jgi:hypothetical protein
MPGSNADDSAASTAQPSELATITTALAEVQRQLGLFATQMSSCIAAVESTPGTSGMAPPPDCPYDMPGYGGLPPSMTAADGSLPPPYPHQHTPPPHFHCMCCRYHIHHHPFHHYHHPTHHFAHPILSPITAHHTSALSTVICWCSSFPPLGVCNL